ncbi:MAG: response regulator [Deltaproteobacteria bacterium]|nr:response regulator [Deltaproteobacteria bacterium]MBW2081954.1 response regulator [Deltaproteobacteria bacterium]HDM09248.1 response regulator transcription factor [Desulfobacteraceae bacterium]
MYSKQSVLIVDDDPDFASAVEKILSSAGYETLLAGSRAEARELLAKKPADLIILDVMMENYDDGFNLCYELKHDERFKHIPIIIVTAVTAVTGLKFNPKTDGEYLEAEEYLEKPIHPEVLLGKVRGLLPT